MLLATIYYNFKKKKEGERDLVHIRSYIFEKQQPMLRKLKGQICY